MNEWRSMRVFRPSSSESRDAVGGAARVRRPTRLARHRGVRGSRLGHQGIATCAQSADDRCAAAKIRHDRGLEEDRFGRSLKHLVNALAELEAVGVAFVSLRDNLDLST